MKIDDAIRELELAMIEIRGLRDDLREMKDQGIEELPEEHDARMWIE